MAGSIFTGLAGLAVLLTLLLYLPPRSYGAAQLVYFLLTFLWGDVALFNIFLQALSLPLWAAAGAFSGQLPWAGLGLMFISWLGLYLYHRIGHRTVAIIEAALRRGLGQDYQQLLPRQLRGPVQGLGTFDWVEPFPVRVRNSRLIGNLSYGDAGERNLLDLYLPEEGEGPWPVLLHIHGGAFFMGDKRQQGRLLINAVPEQGWAVASINYRIGPQARMPAMIEDVKRAIYWIREQGHRFDLNPDCIVTTGGSAGGFLALMAALTANDPEFQPGFEQADTQVQGCMALYGPNDLLGLHGCFDALAYQALNTRHVMPGPPEECLELWQRCSPMYRIHGDLPPVMILGGSHDPLVSAAESGQLIEALDKASRAPLVHAIFPFTSHAFDQTRNSRAIPTIQGLLRFLGWIAAQSNSPIRG